MVDIECSVCSVQEQICLLLIQIIRNIGMYFLNYMNKYYEWKLWSLYEIYILWQVPIYFEFLGFYTGAVEVLDLLGCGAASLGDWCQTFWDISVASSSIVEMSIFIYRSVVWYCLHLFLKNWHSTVAFLFNYSRLIGIS